MADSRGNGAMRGTRGVAARARVAARRRLAWLAGTAVYGRFGLYRAAEGLADLAAPVVTATRARAVHRRSGR